MMADMTLTKTSLIAGVWQGVLTGHSDDLPPDLQVTHQDRVLTGIEIHPEAGGWTVLVPIPAGLIADGVQSFVISDAGTGTVLTSFAIVAGDALAEDIRAEMDLLRAELDMLKRAFRRHCVETAG
jgi:hypothetical protein